MMFLKKNNLNVVLIIVCSGSNPKNHQEMCQNFKSIFFSIFKKVLFCTVTKFNMAPEKTDQTRIGQNVSSFLASDCHKLTSLQTKTPSLLYVREPSDMPHLQRTFATIGTPPSPPSNSLVFRKPSLPV